MITTRAMRPRITKQVKVTGRAIANAFSFEAAWCIRNETRISVEFSPFPA